MADPTLSIPKLPNDVIIEILTRLPVKSLVKFTCVCKSWRTLISSHQFIRTHLQIAKSDPIFTTHRIILNCRGNLKQFSVNSMLYDPISEALELNYSLQWERNSVRVVGSCDGLICLSIDKKDLILWNPSTRISKKLPDFGFRINVGGYFAYGLGFDKSSDDYKVVGFFNSKRDLSEVIVQVYSLRKNQWKRIKNFKGRWLMDDPATFANGKLYWIADQDYELESGWDIVSLDLEKDEYEILQMPSYVKSGYYSRLVASEGSLYVLCSHLASADVWIMDGSCGVGEDNWRKVVTIPYIDDFLKYTYKRVLYVLKNGKVLLLCGLTFVIFDAEDCSFVYPEIRYSGEFVTRSGFDKSSDDYKVVGFFSSKRDLSEVIVQVYRKRIKNFKGCWLMDDPTTFANGKLYWIADQDYELESGWDIVSLDLEKDEYEILQMPSYVKSGYYSRLVASEGSLYVLCSHLASADVWIMDGSCGVGEDNWRKVVTIPYIDDFLKYTYKRVLYVLKNGKVLLLRGLTFVVFDSKDCSFVYPEIRYSGEFVTVGAYFETLVSPLG